MKTQIFTGKKKMQKGGLLRRICWKAEAGPQLPFRWVWAAKWQPKWKENNGLQMERHHSKRGASYFSPLNSQVVAPGILLAFGVPETLAQIESIRAEMQVTGSLLKQKIRRAKYRGLGERTQNKVWWRSINSGNKKGNWDGKSQSSRVKKDILS